MSTSGRLAKHKGAKIPDYELKIEYNHQDTLATYIIFYKSKLKLNEKDSILNFLQICIKGEEGGLG